MQAISPDCPETVDSETPGQCKALAAALPHENIPAFVRGKGEHSAPSQQTRLVK